MLLFLQVRGVQRDPDTREVVRAALEPVREYLPSSPEELRLFRVVSFSAGIGEELFYRGFLIWYLGQFVPPLWAVATSSLLFGLAHVVHGVAATMRAIWKGQILAESDDTVVVEENHYFPRSSLREDFFAESSATSICPLAMRGRAMEVPNR